MRMVCTEGNTVPRQIEWDKKLVKSAGGLDAAEAVIKTHDRQGGTLIHMSLVSNEDA